VAVTGHEGLPYGPLVGGSRGQPEGGDDAPRIYHQGHLEAVDPLGLGGAPAEGGLPAEQPLAGCVLRTSANKTWPSRWLTLPTSIGIGEEAMILVSCTTQSWVISFGRVFSALTLVYYEIEVRERANPPRGGYAKPRASFIEEAAGLPKGGSSHPHFPTIA
jgi:hypothetical protein